jgi:hypothetical protein
MSEREHSAQFPRPNRRSLITDAWGGTEGLHRPGWRIADGGIIGDQCVRDECQRAYDEYRQELENAWKNDPPTGFGFPSATRGQQEADACTINGYLGRLEMIDGALTCVPDPRRRDALSARECPDCEGPGRDEDGDDCDTCNCTRHVEATREPRAVQRAAGNRCDLVKVQRDHQARMDAVYAAYEAELEEAWRRFGK